MSQLFVLLLFVKLYVFVVKSYVLTQISHSYRSLADYPLASADLQSVLLDYNQPYSYNTLIHRRAVFKHHI